MKTALLPPPHQHKCVGRQQCTGTRPDLQCAWCDGLTGQPSVRCCASRSCVLQTNLFSAMALGRRCGCDTATVVTKTELSCTLIGIVTDASLAQGVLTRILLWRWPSVLKTGSILQICPALFCPLQAFLLEDEASQ